jgi:hypothetical protein
VVDRRVELWLRIDLDDVVDDRIDGMGGRTGRGKVVSERRLVVLASD